MSQTTDNSPSSISISFKKTLQEDFKQPQNDEIGADRRQTAPALIFQSQPRYRTHSNLCTNDSDRKDFMGVEVLHIRRASRPSTALRNFTPIQEISEDAPSEFRHQVVQKPSFVTVIAAVS
jgi:hypothetical protein